MKFGNEEAFRVLIVLVPAFIYLAYKTAVILGNLDRFMDASTRKKLFFPVSGVMTWIKYMLLLAAFGFFTVAAARPLGKPLRTDVDYKGIDIMMALDVSTSMAAIDLNPDRMTAVKKGIKDFLYTLAGDRVGLITFAGVDFVQCPLTIDYEAMELIVDNVFPGMLFKDGTALGNAIKACVERLMEKGEKSSIIILITDGENTEGTDPLETAKLAGDSGIRIYTIGVGTREGGRIPAGRDAFGRVHFKTYRGQTVVSKLEDGRLKKIAEMTSGRYYRATDAGAFKKIIQDIRGMEENKSKIKRQVKHEENYALYLLAGIVLFVLSNVLPVRKPVLPKIKLKNEPRK